MDDLKEQLVRDENRDFFKLWKKKPKNFYFTYYLFIYLILGFEQGNLARC